MEVNIKELAQRGALVRKAELHAELDLLNQQFPDGAVTVIRRRRRVQAKPAHWSQTPAARAKASRRMKKYWADRRAGRAAAK